MATTGSLDIETKESLKAGEREKKKKLAFFFGSTKMSPVPEKMPERLRAYLRSHRSSRKRSCKRRGVTWVIFIGSFH